MQTLLPFLTLSLFIILAHSGPVITPCGIRPEECVLEVPHGSTVASSHTGDLLITVPASGDTPMEIRTFKVPPHCGDDIEKIRQRKRTPPMTKPEDTNGWLDYVGWYPPNGENNLRTFTSTYTVPGTPADQTGQVLFYFIGMQDNDSPNAVNILQPVLTWGNGINSWYIKSWICCPSNITVSSPALQGLQPGNQVFGVIDRESPSNWKIDSIFNGQHTTLNAQVGDYIYNWADVTLEVYSVKTCKDFAPGKMEFTSLKLLDQQGATLTPKWNPYTGKTLCNGEITSSGPDSYYIQHTDN